MMMVSFSALSMILSRSLHPVFNTGTRRSVNEGMAFIEHQVTGMHDVCIIKMINCISIGMSRTKIITFDFFVLPVLESIYC